MVIFRNEAIFHEHTKRAYVLHIIYTVKQINGKYMYTVVVHIVLWF